MIYTSSVTAQIQKLQQDADVVFSVFKEISDVNSITLVKEKIAAIANEKASAQSQLIEIDNFILSTPSPKDAKKVIEKNLLDFKTLWRKSTPVQKRKLLYRLFEVLILKPVGMGVRYRRTEVDECGGPSSGGSVSRSARSEECSHTCSA